MTVKVALLLLLLLLLRFTLCRGLGSVRGLADLPLMQLIGACSWLLAGEQQIIFAIGHGRSGRDRRLLRQCLATCI